MTRQEHRERAAWLIKRARKARDLTQQELSDLLGLSGGNEISRWENARHLPANPKAVADVLGLDPSELQDGASPVEEDRVTRLEHQVAELRQLVEDLRVQRDSGRPPEAENPV